MSILKQLTSSESEFLLTLLAETPVPPADFVTSVDTTGHWNNVPPVPPWNNWNNWNNWSNHA